MPYTLGSPTNDFNQLINKPVAFSYFSIWAEEISELDPTTAGGQQFSFGSQVVHQNIRGAIIPVECELIGIGITLNKPDKACVVAATKNGITQTGAQVVTLNNDLRIKYFNDFSLSNPVLYQQGDAFNFKVLSSDDENDATLVIANFRTTQVF
jgi:hypothetical protein